MSRAHDLISRSGMARVRLETGGFQRQPLPRFCCYFEVQKEILFVLPFGRFFMDLSMWPHAGEVVGLGLKLAWYERQS